MFRPTIRLLAAAQRPAIRRPFFLSRTARSPTLPSRFRQPRRNFTATTAAPMADSTLSAGQTAQSAEALQAQQDELLTPGSLETALTQRVEAQYVAVEDMSGGCGQAFEAIVVSPQFEKKTTLARHRLVNSALKEEIAKIHAWTAKCYTPEQWEKVKAERATS